MTLLSSSKDTIPGQAIIGPPCAWCGLPATGTVEVTPAAEDAKGRLIAARVVEACDDHLGITQDQPPPIGRFRQRKAKGVEQLSILDSPASGSAIHGV